MGCKLSLPVEQLSPSSAPLTILVIGLDNSGKTTLSHTINNDIDPIIVPTVGFNAPVRRRISGQPVTFFDLGGGSRIRGVWPQYFADIHGVVFVVDAADPSRFEEAKNELHSALVHPMVVGKPLLVLANKEDLPTAQPAKLLGEALELEKAAVLCRHSIVGCSAKPITTNESSSVSSSSSSTTTKPFIEASTAQGLPTLDSRIGVGLEWLVNAIRNDWDKLEERRKREQLEHKKLEDSARKERLRKIQEETEAATAAAAAAASSSSSSAPVATSEKKNSSASNEAPQCKVCKSAPAVRRCAAAGWEAVCDTCGNNAEAAAATQESSSSSSPTPLSPNNAVTIYNESEEQEQEQENDNKQALTEQETNNNNQSYHPSSPHSSSPHSPLKSSLSSHNVIGTPIHKHAHFDPLAETPLPNQIDNIPVSPAQTDVFVIPSAAPSAAKEAVPSTANKVVNGDEIYDENTQETPMKSPIRGLALSPVFDEAASMPEVVSALPEISSPVTNAALPEISSPVTHSDPQQGTSEPERANNEDPS
jgi:ADP-ribosylation factor-like protein 13B